jgi:hypothetical protein
LHHRPRGRHACQQDGHSTLRIEPEIKEALQRAAELERRSIANMVEVLIREHCRVKGIATGDTSNSKRAARGATL